MLPFRAICLAALALATPAAASELHCLGTAPGFMMVLRDDIARFDYLGDGVFPLSPALSLPLDGVARFDLDTYGGPLPVFVERAGCEMFGAELAFRVEIGIQTSQGMLPMFGCCREAD
jgi:hypothetical protein